MGIFSRFRKPIEPIPVNFPLSFHWTEYWRTVSFDLGEFQDPATYRPGLSKMSFAFALSTFTAMDLSKGGEANAVSFLQQAGFENIHAADDYRHQATASSLGFVFGSRLVKKRRFGKYTLVAVGIRGGHYGAEWGSNAKLGKQGSHQGFYEASERIYAEFLQYLASIRAKKKIAVWVVGYSRAGGVAGLFAQKLSRGMVQGGPPKKFGKAILSLDRIFAYTFAAPKSGEWNGDEYGFIHNVINPDDLVPRIPFASLGFTHYGYSHNLIRSEAKDRELIASLNREGIEFTMPEFTAMTIDFRHIFNKERRFTEDFSRKDGQSGFLDQVCGLLSHRINREIYSKYMQDGIIALSGLVDEQTSSPYEKFLSFLKVLLDGAMEDFGVINLVGKMTSEKTDWATILEPYLDQALEREPELQDERKAIHMAVVAFLHYCAPTKREFLELYPTLRDKENTKAIAFAHEPLRYYMLLLENE